MSRRQPPPPPPGSFPQPFGNTVVSVNPTTSTARNSSRSREGLPSGSIPPPQFPDPGVYPPRQPTTYASTQSSEPPPVRRTTHPHYNASAYAPAPPLTYSHSSSPPHPSAQLPLSGPVSHPSFPVAPVSGGYGSTYTSGPQPPSSSTMPRSTTMPTPGQVNYPQSVHYQNVSGPAPGIAQQPSHSGMPMPGAERHVSGGWAYRDEDAPYADSSSEDEGFEQGREASGDRWGYEQERSPPDPPFSRRSRRHNRPRRIRTEPQTLYPCSLCRHPTPADDYNRLGGFCSERHKWEWDRGQRPQPQ